MTEFEKKFPSPNYRQNLVIDNLDMLKEQKRVWIECLKWIYPQIHTNDGYLEDAIYQEIKKLENK